MAPRDEPGGSGPERRQPASEGHRPHPRLVAEVRPVVAARRHHRGHRRHRDDRAQEPRLRRDRRDPDPERPLRGGGGRHPLRALLHVPSHLHRPEFVARGRRRRRGAAHRRGGRRGGPAGGRHRAGGGGTLPARRGPEDGLDRQLPVEGGRDRVPRGGRHRRRHRGAARSSPAPRPTGRTRGRNSPPGSAGSARSTGPRWSSAGSPCS